MGKTILYNQVLFEFLNYWVGCCMWRII